jgi:hypothetical protein
LTASAIVIATPPEDQIAALPQTRTAASDRRQSRGIDDRLMDLSVFQLGST